MNTESVYLSCVRCCSFGFSKTQNGPGDGSPAAGMTGALQVESQKKNGAYFLSVFKLRLRRTEPSTAGGASLAR